MTVENGTEKYREELLKWAESADRKDLIKTLVEVHDLNHALQTERNECAFTLGQIRGLIEKRERETAD